MRKLSRLIVVFAALALMGQGCKTDYFDRDFVDTVLHLSFHNDVVDPNHTWTLINEGVMQVVVDVPDVAQVMLLSATPLGNAKAEILASAEVMVGSPSRFSLHYALPLIQDKLYVGATMTDGSHLLGEIDRSKFSINVSSLQSVSESTWNEPSMQEVYYCYCNGYPQPSSSWDFNDLVLRIGRTLVDDYTIRLHVTLVAVGTKVQQAAAIRLYGVPYDEVESVTPVNNKRFVDNTSLVRSLIREDDDLLESRKGEAVINLFDDAHAAIYQAPDGNVVRRYFNTMKENGSTSAKASAKTVTYIFTFNTEYEARTFSLTEFDPFILVRYGTSGDNFWEVHTYPYKLTEVLFPYYNGAAQSYDNGFIWALAIPSAKFRYPVEGMAIGELKKGIVAGAYQEKGLSFGDWILNENNAQDWYLYPADGAVY